MRILEISSRPDVNESLRVGSAGGHLDKQALLDAAKQIVQDDDFKRWFAGSKVANGAKPIVVYHGTVLDFSQFDPSRAEDADEVGIFFTTNGFYAAQYAQENGRVIPAFLRVLKPYIVTLEEWNEGDGLSPREAALEGYDGYLIKGLEGGATWIVFSSENIREIIPTKTRCK